MSAIEKALRFWETASDKAREQDFSWYKYLLLCNAARAELAALRAENAAQAKQIETAFREIDLACKLFDPPEGSSLDEAWRILHGSSSALASLAPSDMCLVPAKRLERLEEALIQFFAMPGSPVGEGWAAETLGTDIITLNVRAADRIKYGSAIVPVERLREIEWFLVYSSAVGDKIEEVYACPCCGQERSEGHAPGCWLGNALKGDTCPE